MVLAFARDRRVVVAAGATAGRIAVIEIGGQPACGGMTTEAILGDRNVIRIHAGCRVAVMATGAGADHLNMIDPGGRTPAARAVTILAHIAGRHMVRTFTVGWGAAMTTDTGARNAAVIVTRRAPGAGGMAV